MSQRCFEPEDLGRVVELPQSHPERVHLQSCPRCRSLLRQFEAFRDGPAVLPQGVDVEQARIELDRRLTAAIASPETSRQIRSGHSGKIFRLPMVLAAAAIVVVGIGLSLWNNHRLPTSPTLRGAQPTGTRAMIHLDEVKRLGETWQLSWGVFPGADTYQIDVYSGSLQPVGHFGPVIESTLSIARSDLRGGILDPPLRWRVTALKTGDVIARSPLGILPE